MNPAERDCRDYLDDILENARKLKSFVAGLSFEEFQADEKTQYATMRAIEVIGEATKRLPNDFRERHPENSLAQYGGHARHSHSINMKVSIRASCTPQRRAKSMW